MQPTRFEIDGVRYYRTGDDPNRFYPSVTAILGKTSSEASKKALNTWSLNNPGGREAAAKRGTAIHYGAECYARGLPVEIPEEYQCYWRGIEGMLDRYDGFLWSEKPLRPEWKFCTGEDDISRLWSHKYQYCGCPDIIGTINNTVVLADFKTSVNPYYRHYSKDRKDNRAFSGFSKYRKCAMQLAAYAMACEETLGLRVDCAQIMVSTPETFQNFYVLGDELQRYKIKWRQKVREYWDIVAREQEEAHQAAAEPAAELLESA